jgi:ADP-dependent NAD(P)H-hydrate dehydratase
MSGSHSSPTAPTEPARVADLTDVTPRVLRGWPLPQPGEEGDKEERGQVVVVGGSREMPGAVILAATAALRAGAGKLRIATGESIALAVAASIPEARIFALPETEAGAVNPSAAAAIAQAAVRARALLIGPGMTDESRVVQLVRQLLPQIPHATCILDAAALTVVTEDRACLRRHGGNGVLTPHAGEMAGMLGVERDEVMRDPVGTVRQAAAEWQAVIALKGAETFIAAPDGELYRNRTGNVGLATSGSGDTLAGIVAGLAARGAEPLQAAVWSVYLHARAGDRLAARMGRLGFLARELLDEIPPLMADLEQPRSPKRRERVRSGYRRTRRA